MLLDCYLCKNMQTFSAFMCKPTVFSEGSVIATQGQNLAYIYPLGIKKTRRIINQHLLKGTTAECFSRKINILVTGR